MYQINNESKKALEEISMLLEELSVTGSKNAVIMTNVFTRLQQVIQELNNAPITMDNTKEE